MTARVVHLHGVNRSGSEYACIQGWGIFELSGQAIGVVGEGVHGYSLANGPDLR